jgi:hypothetical protein
MNATWTRRNVAVVVRWRHSRRNVLITGNIAKRIAPPIAFDRDDSINWHVARTAR